MTPQLIIDGAIKLITKHNWRKSVYTTIVKDAPRKDKILYHTSDMPCFMCGTKMPITGITVEDALLKAFNALSPPCWKAGDGLTFGKVCENKELLRKTLQDHERAYFETKCLIARMDSTIHVREVDVKDGFLHPLYIDLAEWNDRKDQTKENVLHILGLALVGNLP